MEPGPLIRPLEPVWARSEVAEQEAEEAFGTTQPSRRRQRLVGSLVHEAIASGLLAEDPDGPALESWLTARAQGLELTAPAWLSSATKRALALVNRLRQHPFWQQILEAEQRLYEIPYVVKVESGDDKIRYNDGRIDLLYLHEGLWTVVDFKTNPLQTPAELERLVRGSYRRQLTRYHHAVGTLLGQEPRCVLCFLDYRGKVHVQPVLFS